MSITLTSVFVRHERRILLSFSNTLAAGAFTSTSFYVIANTDGAGASPLVVAAIPITGAVSQVDLALDTDLVGGGQYTIFAVGVPCTDTSVTPGGTQLGFTLGTPADDSNVEQATTDIASLVYGTDLVWSGADFVETATGDLATVSGVQNYEAAITRRLTTPYVLPWAPSYGARSGDYVNAPRGSATVLRGALIRQAYADDRTLDCQVTLGFDDANDPTAAVYLVNITPKSADDANKLTIAIPIQG